MADPGIETYYEDGQWKSRTHGASRAFAAGGNKEDQTAVGRDAAKRREVEHTIKNMNGRIGKKNSYGNDPPDVRG